MLIACEYPHISLEGRLWMVRREGQAYQPPAPFHMVFLYLLRGVETLTRTLPIDIFSCSPFATIFSPMFEYILRNIFSHVGVNLMHAIKSKCLFGFGSCLV